MAGGVTQGVPRSLRRRMEPPRRRGHPVHDDDCVMCLSAGPDTDGRRLVGQEAVRAATTEAFKTPPDAQWNGATHFVDGDRGVTQWTFTATRPDGTKISSAGCDLFVFRDGVISVKDSYCKQFAY